MPVIILYEIELFKGKCLIFYEKIQVIISNYQFNFKFYSLILWITKRQENKAKKCRNNDIIRQEKITWLKSTPQRGGQASKLAQFWLFYRINTQNLYFSKRFIVIDRNCFFATFNYYRFLLINFIMSKKVNVKRTALKRLSETMNSIIANTDVKRCKYQFSM